MKIINTATADLGKMSTLEQLALYNGMDNLALPEIHSRLSKELDPIREATYRFEIDLQAPLLEMSFNGIHTDATERAWLIGVNEQAKTKVEGYLHTLLSAIGYYEYYRTIARARFACQADIDLAAVPRTWADWVALPIATRKELKAKAGAEATKDLHKWIKQLDQPFNADSNAQKMRLFYHFFGHSQNQISRDEFEDFPPPWNKTHGISEYKTRNQKGEYTPSVDRDCLEKLRLRANGPVDAAYWALPFISCCLAIADYSKSLQFLRCKLENGMFRSSFATGPETGRLSSRRNAQGYGWNAQNVAPPLRTIFTCLPGWKMATPDYEQIESRMVAARCFIQFGAVKYIAATESGDLHSLACSMVWEDLPWPEDFTIDWLLKHGPFPKDMVAAAKEIAKKEGYRGKSRRDLSKTLGHGTNYWGKPPNMAKQSHIDLGLVKHYQQVYFEAFPEIQQWHNWIIEQIQVKGECTTIFGRTRQFFGRPSDDATIREAIAHDGQSPAADYTNNALLRLHKAVLVGDLPIEIFLQKHDEIGFRYLESDENEVLPKVKAIMEQPRIITAPDGTTREWVVPVEMQSGWNLGKYQKAKNKDGTDNKNKNLDGVLEWTGNDPRTRTRNPFDIKNLVL